MGVLEILFYILFAALVFPGLVFISALALFTEWFIRKIEARMQNRMGPSYVGPFGLLQPLADMLKLFSVKEEIRQRYSVPGIAVGFAVLGIGAAVAALFLLPLSPIRIAANYDFLIYLYLCSLWIPVAIIFMSLSMPNPFTGVGISRLLTMIIVYEPAYFISIFIPVVLVSHFYGGDAFYSILFTSMNSGRLWLNPLAAIAMVFGLVAILVSTQTKTMLQPFNIPEAEQEIIAGFATEFSGPILALYNFLHDVEITVTILAITYLYLGGPYPYPHLSIPGILLLIVKFLAVLFIVCLVKAVFGRLRIDQAVKTMFKYSFIPAFIGIVITSVLVFAMPP
ncbi:MAG: NADH-quinone oxidoreductase subunit H [Desulfurococcales archaeon]|nr:NADH-quinone oxidoreductase subunit H [Desulfurococcales archaeon]